MKNLSIFLAFFCIYIGCKKQIKTKKTKDIIYQCSEGVPYPFDDCLSKCCGGNSFKPIRSSRDTPQQKPLCLHKNSPILKPKRFDLLCKEIKNFNIKQELIGTNDSVIFNISAYKKAFLSELQKAKHEQYFLKLQRLLCIYQKYKVSTEDNENSSYVKSFFLSSCFGAFEYTIKNQKIVSAKEDCFIDKTVFKIKYRYTVLYDTTVAKLPELMIDFNLLQGETYKITGGGIIWVNGKINAEKYTKNGE